MIKYTGETSIASLWLTCSHIEVQAEFIHLIVKMRDVHSMA